MDLRRLAGGVLHHPEPAASPVAFAASELAGYLGRIFGASPRLSPHPGAAGSWLALTAPEGRGPTETPTLPPGAEYAVRPDGQGLVLTGASPRALLHATYALLEAVGCRWSPHGSDDEHIPDRTTAVTAVPDMVGRPAFARRAYASDLAAWHYSMPDRLAERLSSDVAFIDWMAKSGATGFLFIRHANDTAWVVPDLVPELAKRGLAVEGGGHAIVELLPRTLFDEHPEYFPAGADGRRSDLGNLCSSSRAALGIVRERAASARSALAGTTDLHLWGLDLVGGGWCHCGSCAHLTPSDQALSVCNAASEGLPAGGRVFHLAYHDTVQAPRTVRPSSTVWAEFAPRERCYSHAIDDPECATNQPYRAALEQHVDLFDGRVDVFEYYADAILFGGCAIPLVEVVARDLEYYAAAGVQGVSCLLFGQYSLLAYGANVEAFASGSIQPTSARTAVANRCRRRYQHVAGPMTHYLQRLERALTPAVTYGDVKLPPRDRTKGERVRASLDSLVAEAPALRRRLAEATNGTTNDALAAEAHLLDYTLDTLAAVRDWLAARESSSIDGAEIANAVAAMTAAVDHLRRIPPDLAGTWGRYDAELVDAVIANLLLAPDPPKE